jgi:hypothetical protein
MIKIKKTKMVKDKLLAKYLINHFSCLYFFKTVRKNFQQNQIISLEFFFKAGMTVEGEGEGGGAGGRVDSVPPLSAC